ncbi:MAG TPA: DUF4166 domain-containing protein [Steroidobacteraceae bacterium]|nr:DUF4166 domain-containing protein [Steroidobacteraceae bacterium]
MTDVSVLIVGGYGTFGGRLARLLKDEAITILIAGRSLAMAQRFCDGVHGRAKLIPVQFDRDGNIHEQLGTLSPTIVVDASGPFQVYGLAPYRLIDACIERGIHYLDLAGAASFVAGVAAFNERAKSRGVFVLSGVSSVPVLSAAVVHRLAEDLSKVLSITAGIAPSPRAGVGLSVIKAIASYAGTKIRLRRDGGDTTAFALLEQRWQTIAPAGALPLRPRMFSLVEVPDLQLLQTQWPELREVWVGAAPVPLVLHRFLIVFAWLRRWRLFPSLVHFAALMHLATRHLRWGEHRGGMFVTVQGLDDQNRLVRKSWFLIAEEDSGPFIPSMAAEAVIRKLLEGEAIPAGARHALGDVDLSDYEQLFAKHRIVNAVRTTPRSDASLFERVLGEKWDQLPEELRTLHRGSGSQEASGMATVARGKRWLARLLTRVFGFPQSGDDIPIRVSFAPSPTGERWTRRFGTREFHSELSAGAGEEEGLLIERFGPFSFGLALVWDEPRLKFIVRHWRLGPIPLPLWLAPISEAHECVEHGRFKFDVGISHPIAGLLVRYQGWLAPQ